ILETRGRLKRVVCCREVSSICIPQRRSVQSLFLLPLTRLGDKQRMTIDQSCITGRFLAVSISQLDRYPFICRARSGSDVSSPRTQLLWSYLHYLLILVLALRRSCSPLGAWR